MRSFIYLALLLTVPQIQAANAQACTCGPDFCQGDGRIAAKLAEKKRSLSRQYPANLVALLDRGQQCVARIERSPGAFTMWIIHSDNSKETVPWSAQNQADAMQKVRSGELKRFWIYNAKRAFSCCGQPLYNQMSDYDEEDEVNGSVAVKCDTNNPC